ncbi:MAG: serine hydrolase domain-containing protein, partial [Pseudorhizobium sp.]
MIRQRFLFALLAIMVFAAAAVAQQVSDPTAPPAEDALVQASDQHPLTAIDLGAWLDGFMSIALQQGKIAGAQVVVVKQGQVLLKRGYGYADIAAGTKMDADRHQMRIGSTSKLFVWTAVMQLAEAGKIDLHVDVNRYLDFKISPPGGRPMTMSDLMAHRGGFEEGLKDVLATDPKRLKATERYLKENARPF